MPNWCEGTLRVRGKMSDLKWFVAETIQSTSFEWTEGIPITKTSLLEIEEYGGATDCGFSVTGKVRDAWIVGTTRHFVQEDYIETYSKSWDDVEILYLRIQAAWGMNAEQLLKLCADYSLDMRVYGFERGMEFNQEIEIIDGTITVNREIKFQDYRWECVCPDVGG